MLNKIYKVSGLVVASSLPSITYAQEKLGKPRDIFAGIYGIVTSILIPLAFTLALLFFFWGVAKYILAVGGDAKEEGKKIMVWGVIALFVMSSVWGLVYFIRGELIGNTNPTTVPVPTIGRSADNGND